jgi:RNA polymerase sigma factor (sigma-70 family)
VRNKVDLNLILTDCACNSRKSQEKLFKLYYGKMLYLCLRYFKDRDTAQEVVQEGFIKVFEKIKMFDKSGSFDSWIGRLMTNTAIDYIRKNKKISFTEITDPITHELYDDEIEDLYEEKQMNAKIALESIQELSPAYRTVFNLFVVEEYTHKEIAEKLGISEGTSKSNLAKAKQNLKNIIEKKGIKS